MNFPEIFVKYRNNSISRKKKILIIIITGPAGWDRGVAEASEIYKHRIHNLFCDNCHSHVATALDQMQYNSRNDWNMVKLAFLMFIKGRYVG